MKNPSRLPFAGAGSWSAASAYPPPVDCYVCHGSNGRHSLARRLDSGSGGPHLNGSPFVSNRTKLWLAPTGRGHCRDRSPSLTF